MRIYAIRIFVDNWPQACEFYEHTLGLPLVFKEEEFGWAEFDLGGAKIGLERVDTNNASNEESELVGRFVGVSLQVENIEQTYNKLIAKGVSFTAPPEKQGWGGTMAHLKDPSGNILTLVG